MFVVGVLMTISEYPFLLKRILAICSRNPCNNIAPVQLAPDPLYPNADSSQLSSPAPKKQH